MHSHLGQFRVTSLSTAMSFGRLEETSEPRGKPVQTQGEHAQSLPGEVCHIWTPEQYPQVIGGHPLSNK